MKYKGYYIKMDLNSKKIHFKNEIDDCVITIKNPRSTLRELELFIMDTIDKRVKYLTY